jgi:hypothetical protein
MALPRGLHSGRTGRRMTSLAAHSLAAACLLALVHLLASRLRFLRVQPRSVWLSVGGGISVAYVFLHLLPELQEHQQTIGGAAGGVLRGL